MKMEDLLELTEGELHERLDKCSQEYFELKMKKGLGQLKAPSDICKLKKDMAQIKGVLSQKLMQK